jgi:hypothetical protein
MSKILCLHEWTETSALYSVNEVLIIYASSVNSYDKFMQKVQYIQVSHWFICPNGKKDKSFCAQCGSNEKI